MINPNYGKNQLESERLSMKEPDIGAVVTFFKRYFTTTE
jgi:hypothetical protein